MAQLHVVGPDDPRAPAWLARAIDGLDADRPAASARQRLVRHQAIGLAASVPVVVALVVWQPVVMAVTGVVVATLGYLGVLAYRGYLLRATFRTPAMVRVADERARAVPDHDLPTYTVMVPAYREPEVVPGLLASLDRLEYPDDRLQVLLLLEEGDDATLDAVRATAAQAGERSARPIEVVVVPDAEPRTKPKALNYGLGLARGQVVTIYDAEDHPEPLQLRRAAVALAELPPEVACLQARLVYHNPRQNLLTRWFAAEYLMWFSAFLPGLVAMGAPLPLGGTSNHFRREVLDAAGGWDPYNVTEDADLGMRLHRSGYEVRVLDSITWEEANSDLVNWVKQRSRWYKGYLQTWLVHMRHPRQLVADLGWGGVVAFTLFVGGTPTLAALNPVFWGLSLLWLIARPDLLHTLFPGPVLYLALLSLVVGNLSVIYANVVSARMEDPRLVAAAYLSPLYWALMSVAATKALWQLVFRPAHWEKTAHGLVAAPALGHPVKDPA